MRNPRGGGRPSGPNRSGPTEQLVEQLVAACLEQRDGQGSTRLESILRNHPELADEVRATLRVVDSLGLERRSILPGPGCQVGAYRIEGRLGGGAMGVVYAAVHETTGEPVALKMVRPEFVMAEKVRDRFEREVAAVSRLDHPAVVGVHGWGEADGAAFLVMERVPGCTLAEALERLSGRDPRHLSGADLRRALCQVLGSDPRAGAGHELFAGTWEQTCLRVVRQVARALDHTHRAGVMHRDVKPSNIMLTPEGRVLLIDFGLARSTEGARMTNTGSAVGSELYMAPEVHRGETSGGVATDVYALGVTLHEMLTLAHPFEAGSVPATRRAIVAGTARRLPGWVGREAATVCRHAMDVSARRRFAGAGVFARDLTAALSGRAVRQWRAGPLRRVGRWLRRHDVPVATAAALLVAVVGVGLSVAGLESARNAWERADHFEQMARGPSGGAAGSGASRAVVPEPVQLVLAQVELPELPVYEPPVDVDPLARAQDLMLQAREALAEGDLETALEQAKQAVALHRGHPGDTESFLESLLLLAELQRAAGNLAAAHALEAEAARLRGTLGRRDAPVVAATSAPGVGAPVAGPLALPPSTPLVSAELDEEPATEGTANLGVQHIDLGYALHGDNQMQLSTSGGTTIDEPVHVRLGGAQPKQVTVLVIGWAAGFHPLHFGVLVPEPEVLMPLVCDGLGGGQWELTSDWLVNDKDFPSVWMQFLAKDPGTPVGWGYSNAVRIDAH